MSQNSKTHSREIYLVARSLFICLALAGCEQLPQLHLPQSTPQIVFDTAPVADPVLSAAVRVSRGPEENEDPSIILARDGRFYVAWSAKQRGRVDLFISSSADGRVWSEERRIHDIAAEDYNPALMQSRDGRFHLVWCQLQRKEGRTDVWYTTSKDGKVWDKPKSITNRGIDWAPTIYEDNKGTLRILWSSRRSGSRDIWVTRSLDGGKTWLAPDQVTRSSEEDDFPNALQAANGERQANYRWRCRDCKQQFTVRVGTVFEDSRAPLRHWCFAFWRASTSKKGVSALEIHRQTGLSYKSCLFMPHGSPLPCAARQ